MAASTAAPARTGIGQAWHIPPAGLRAASYPARPAPRSAAGLPVLRAVQADHLGPGFAGLRPGGQVLLDRVEDGQALADQARGDLTEAICAVQHVDVRAGQAARGLLDDLRELVDEQ